MIHPLAVDTDMSVASMSVASASAAKTLPFDEAFIRKLTEKYPTPFYIYDERAIRENACRMNAALRGVTAFKSISPSKRRRTRISSKS